MAKVTGYSGRELPVDESVYDDNATLMDKAATEERFRQKLFAGLTLEQQNEIRARVGLKPLIADTQARKPAMKFGDALKN